MSNRYCIKCGFKMDDTSNAVCKQCAVLELQSYGSNLLKPCEHCFEEVNYAYTSPNSLRKYQCKKCLEIRWSE